ncbi:hypothetical protein JAK58_08735 [Stenotrophomonas maltophilia]|jgi:hypothetical protein|uniref:hypothetical protein n=1 Tax=Stenotrophomonas TaxID=40323 RepID=UPI0013116DD4|nr:MULTISPECIES: hypothetical protein [Stenotrophomonas]MBA0223576.1 hypothetical protein [Stenotrophomonas maltophilia]MBE5271974.1 hypothetical protein [Stenotrophomonas sp. B2]MBH1592945.1 hypothetical protein [Stenotrophomonas maltophilia]MCU1091601.1 hypothetical protein [Stenotrophomonas maltophilia]MDH2024679.1 hypothetical protein [Stenotrophomonas sp. GD03680]
MIIRHFLLLLALCMGPSANAQQYSTGSTDIKTAQGTLRVNSGYVSHSNAHSFHVYSFQYRPIANEAVWNQLPLLARNDAPPVDFLVKATATADFPLRDARVRVEAGKVVLYIAELSFKDTPYDDDAAVELKRYLLKQQPDEERWVLVLDSTRRLPQGVDVAQALSTLTPR